MPLDFYEVDNAEGWTIGDAASIKNLFGAIQAGIIISISWDTEFLEWNASVRNSKDIEPGSNDYWFWAGPLKDVLWPDR